MTIQEALKEASTRLQNPKEARILLAHHLKVDRVKLIMIEAQVLPDADNFWALVTRAKAHEPIEYITQSVSFYAREFHIQKGALIPRPESEILVDKTIAIAKDIPAPHIAEIGVGSGIISIMIALLLDDVAITASDISKDALAIAKINAKRLGVEDKITFIHTPYLQNIDQKFDIIVSNPPYIAQEAPLEKNLSYEPDIALFGGEVGDEILKEIIDITSTHEETTLCCEMGYDQKNALQSYLIQSGYHDIHFYQDLSGLDRGFTAKTGAYHRS